jgi:hypothetical protein
MILFKALRFIKKKKIITINHKWNTDYKRKCCDFNLILNNYFK